jgi:hypothetical protein
MKEEIKESREPFEAEKTRIRFRRGLESEVNIGLDVIKQAMKDSKNSSFFGKIKKAVNGNTENFITLWQDAVLQRLEVLAAWDKGDLTAPANYLETRIKENFVVFDENFLSFNGSGRAATVLGEMLKDIGYLEAFDPEKAKSIKKEMNSKSKIKR